MKNKKGFTLIELLAVIVILAIIALIAVPLVLNMIENARRSAAKSSAYGYIDAIDNNNKLAGMKNNDMDNIPDVIDDGTYEDVTSIDIKIKGKKPTSGSLTITNGKVSNATNLCFYNYPVSYDGTVATVGNKGCSGSDSSSGPKSLTPQTDVAGPTSTSDGIVVYFDPVSTSKCDSTTFDIDAVKAKTSTCYKWRIIARDGNNLTVQMDHFLIRGYWGGTYIENGPNHLLPDLATATSSWSRVSALNYTYDTTTATQNNYGKLSCKYGICNVTKSSSVVAGTTETPVRARVITVEEIAKISVNAGASADSLAGTWSLTSPVYFYTSSGTSSQGNSTQVNKVKWLVENTQEYTQGGGTANAYGMDENKYWTLTPYIQSNSSLQQAFLMTQGGSAYYSVIYNTIAGVRPVLTLPKCVFDGNKCSGWHLINPETESWSYYESSGEMIYNGWGRQLNDLSGNKQDYYFVNGTAIKGWKTIDNKKYYFSETDSDNNGYIDYNKVYGGDIEINGTTYTFDNDGVCTSNNC